MAVTVFVDAPAREPSSRAVDTSVPSYTTPAALPPANGGSVHNPSPDTLKMILRLHGCLEMFIDPVVDGYVPREFNMATTPFWKIRDAFYELAAHSVRCFAKHTPVGMTLAQIIPIIVEGLEPGDPCIYNLIDAANKVTWTKYTYPAGTFEWPLFIPSCIMSRDLLTTIRLYVLCVIWSLNPAILLPVDFSAGLAFFSNETCASVQTLIADAIQSRPALPESTDKSDASTTAETAHVEHAAQTAEVQRLLDILQDGEKSCQELQERLGVKRNMLLKYFLDPARKTGLVVPTKQGSSPKQRYRLVSADETEGEKQVSDNIETGLKKPVSASDVLPQKQVDLSKTGVFSPVAMSVFAGGHAPVRLARYVRWPEAERAMILFGRVERFLRNSCASEERIKIGIVDKFTASDLVAFENCLFDPKYWGANAGVVLRKEFVDSKGKLTKVAVGESNLLNLFAQKTGLDLAVCSKSERAEMGRLAMIIPNAVLYLTNFYAQRFRIPHDLDKPYHGSDNVMQPAAVEPFNLYHSGMDKIIFHGKDRAPLLHVGRLDVAGQTLLLPLMYYASALNSTSQHCMFPEVPDHPALYNADAIATNPGATIILTDEIGIPLVNDSDVEFIFTSWYGGMEVIDKLELDLLEGHPIRWLCFDSGDGPAEMYEKAVKVGDMIFQHHGRKIAFQVFDGVTWTRNAFGMDTGTYECSRTLSFDELMAEASKFGVGGCGSNEVADLRALSMDDLVKLKPKDFTLYPLLKEGFYCLIYGGSGVAKTWFALHLAICLSQGRAPFNGWEFRGKAPLNVLYVAGEMKPEEYGDRLRKLLADQKTNARFRLVREDLDLATPEDQERVIKAVNDQKSQVVVLDNLSTLATNGHTEGQFEKVLALIRKLQADGIIVILVHHENRKGGFKGSSKIETVTDQSLHLFPAGNGENIELLVQAEKIRMTSKAEQTAFHATFDPNQPTAVWATKDLTPEERRRLDEDDPLGEVEMNVGKKRNDKRLAWRFLNDDDRAIAIIYDTLSGCRDDVIAANLAVREIAVTEFKQQSGITEEAMKQCMPMARESAETKHGKKFTPGDLALEIWNQLKTKG